MKKLLLNACAVASFAVPGLSLAQGYDRDHPPVAHDQHPNSQQNVHAQTNVNRDVDVNKNVNVNKDVNVNRNVNVHQNVRVDTHTQVYSAGNRYWYRGRPEFAGYVGARPGYWYVPGRGYLRPDPRWYGYSWRVGGYVPPIYRGYYVTNPYIYGLGVAPYGFRYVYLGNNVVLMSVSDGRIVRVMANVY